MTMGEFIRKWGTETPRHTIRALIAEDSMEHIQAVAELVVDLESALKDYQAQFVEEEPC